MADSLEDMPDSVRELHGLIEAHKFEEAYDYYFADTNREREITSWEEDELDKCFLLNPKREAVHQEFDRYMLERAQKGKE